MFYHTTLDGAKPRGYFVANNSVAHICYLDDEKVKKLDSLAPSELATYIDRTVPGDFTKDDWGWTNLAGARVVKAGRKGYMIDFPKVRPI